MFKKVIVSMMAVAMVASAQAANVAVRDLAPIAVSTTVAADALRISEMVSGMAKSFTGNEAIVSVLGNKDQLAADLGVALSKNAELASIFKVESAKLNKKDDLGKKAFATAIAASVLVGTMDAGRTSVMVDGQPFTQSDSNKVLQAIESTIKEIATKTAKTTAEKEGVIAQIKFLDSLLEEIGGKTFSVVNVVQAGAKALNKLKNAGSTAVNRTSVVQKAEQIGSACGKGAATGGAVGG